LRGISRIKYTTLMRTQRAFNQRAFIFFSVFCLLIFSGLILNVSKPVPAAPKKDAPAGKNVPAKSVPESISGVSTGFSATQPDPKRPGKMLYEMHGGSLNGFFSGGQAKGTINSVWVRLYQNGSPAAVLTAPHAHGSDAGKAITITGTGGVVVKSLTVPGTKMTADTMVWYANTNRIVATGHVFYRSGKNGATLIAPHMEANTVLKEIYIPNGGHGMAKF